MSTTDAKEQIQKLETGLRSQVLGIVRVLGDKRLTVGFAESCTGGLLSSFMTELSGVSQVFMGSVVSYDNKVKQKFLNVSEETLKNFGAVSSQTAKQMAEGALKALEVSVAVSVTGIAGPTGGTDVKPVGTVFVAVAGMKNETKIFEHHFNGDRKSIQLQTCIEAIRHLNEFIKT
ncbi:MAG: CinA family protein [Pseudobdellovibrio sp.]